MNELPIELMKRCTVLVQRFGADVQIHGMQVNDGDQEWVCVVRRVVGAEAGAKVEAHGATKEAAITEAERLTADWRELNPLLDDMDRNADEPLPVPELPPFMQALPGGLAGLIGGIIGSLIGDGIADILTPRSRPKGQKCRACRCDDQHPVTDGDGVLRCPCCLWLWVDEDKPRLAKGGKMKNEG